jgi:hypothetical protein
VNVCEALSVRIRDAEARLASCVERAEAGDVEQAEAALAFATVVVVLREVRGALQDAEAA